jgi:plasmid stabilization system protein ParE
MIVYAPRALRDIKEILDWTAQQSPKGAHSLSIAIERAIAVCEAFPRAGARTDEPAVYRWPMSKHRVTIFYRTLANDAGIEVARVLRSGRIKTLRTMPND